MSSVYNKNEISSQIIYHSRRLFEKGGIRSFSYKDLSKMVGIKTSSIHYYFPSKQDLALALVIDYRDELMKKWQETDKSGNNARSKIYSYLESYAYNFKVTNNPFFGTMLVSSFGNLNTEVQDEVDRLFRDHIAFLARLLRKAKEDRLIFFDEDPEHLAELILSLIEGAAIISKASGNNSIPENVNIFLEKYFESKGKGFISKYLSITR